MTGATQHRELTGTPVPTEQQLQISHAVGRSWRTLALLTYIKHISNFAPEECEYDFVKEYH